MNKVSFQCSLYRQTTDKEGEIKLVLLVPQSDSEELVRFFIENTGKPLQAALLELPTEVGR